MSPPRNITVATTYSGIDHHDENRFQDDEESHVTDNDHHRDHHRDHRRDHRPGNVTETDPLLLLATTGNKIEDKNNKDDDYNDDDYNKNDDDKNNGSIEKGEEKVTYELSVPFQLMSGFVWFSMFLWGIWISIFYSTAVMFDYEKLNIVFPDLWTASHPFASWSIVVHFVGAAYMTCAGSFQLVKYVRKRYPKWHRWVGRLYVIASLIASTGGLLFCLTKGSYGGKPADYAFVTYGIIFLVSGIKCYYHAVRKEYHVHKLWAWRLYSLSLAAWLYRFDYYVWMLFFGKGDDAWLHRYDYYGWYDFFINWAFYVPGLVVVEIVYRWGETATLPSRVSRLLDVGYGIVFVLAVVFTCHAMVQLWIPSIIDTYDYEHGWIM